MESLHSLLDWGVGIESVAWILISILYSRALKCGLTLEDIDVVQLQAPQARLDGVENMLYNVNKFHRDKCVETARTFLLRPRWLMTPNSSGVLPERMILMFGSGDRAPHN